MRTDAGAVGGRVPSVDRRARALLDRGRTLEQIGMVARARGDETLGAWVDRGLEALGRPRDVRVPVLDRMLTGLGGKANG